MDLISIATLTLLSISNPTRLREERSCTPPDPSGKGAGSRATLTPSCEAYEWAEETHARPKAPRTRMVGIRLTDDEYGQRRLADARGAGLSLSGLCERLVCDGKVEPASHGSGYRQMHPALIAEWRRIGNNLNQVAHVVNSGLPPIS